MILLVGCVKGKRPVPAPASELYASPLFAKRKAFALASGLPWFILSPLHGVLHPDEVIAPYDKAIGSLSRDELADWGTAAVERLAELVPGLGGQVAAVHAGVRYVDGLEPTAARVGLALTHPVAGLSQGQHLAHYKALGF